MAYTHDFTDIVLDASKVEVISTIVTEHESVAGVKIDGFAAELLERQDDIIGRSHQTDQLNCSGSCLISTSELTKTRAR